MSKRAMTDQHARERLKERYDIDLDDRGRKEVLRIIRRCDWVPLELQGTRIRALLKYEGRFINIVFESVDLVLVTALPLNEDRLTPDQFERARLTFPDLASCSGAPVAPVPAAPVKVSRSSAPKPLPAEPDFFETVVLIRFGRDKKKALAWWTAPNPELGSKSPVELSASGKLERVRRFLELSKREGRVLRIPQRRDTADLQCPICRGYPPQDQSCRCEPGHS